MKRYPIRIPKAALGIRMGKVSKSGESWWARRWLASLEAMRLGARLGRGRTYALDGQVVELELDLDEGRVSATVAGSRAEPYKAGLVFSRGGEKARAELGGRIAAEPMIAGRLLAGDMPLDVAEMFQASGLALFPAGGTKETGYDIKMTCTCPDWSRPCKHLVAVMLLLGEEISRFPLTLLELRGVSIWDGRVEPVAQYYADAHATDTNPAPLIGRLGALALWRGFARFPERIVKIASRARPPALKAAAAKSIDLR